MEAEKLIRTTNGGMSKAEFSGSVILPYEHIIQNLCDFLIPNK
jgi:hypothetical protein